MSVLTGSIVAGWLALAVAGPVSVQAPSVDAAASPEAARAAMIDLIELKVRSMADQTGVATLDRRVVRAFGAVPRHAFLPEAFAPYAYLDTPLPLGHGQNLTMPLIAALMTQLLEVRPGERVLETGTDIGYHAAILSNLGAEVYSVEIVAPLLAVARDRLPALGHGKVRLKGGDGWYGWAEEGPYDAILLKESAAEIPPPLWRQLKPGGRLIMPLGPPNGQDLVRIVKEADGKPRIQKVLPVRFAPFQGGERT